jgi:uncharacterized protein (TIGR00255 family)
MTGFGAGEAPLGAGKIAVEIRGTNNRFLDVRVRMPHALVDLAGFAEGALRERLTRGRYDVTVHVGGGALGMPVLDRERARAAFRALGELRDEIAPGQEVPLTLLASVPGVFAPALDKEIDAAKDALRAAIDTAVRAMDGMRAREGAALARDLSSRVETARAKVREIAARAPEIPALQRRRLHDRVERLRAAGDFGVDAARLEQEIVLYADRVDITEELTRLESHLDQVAALASADESVGRRLDFLLQEVAREANTIGSKSPDLAISHAVVEVKTEIERMREQVQNVE